MTDRALKISGQQIDFIRLVQRSPDLGDGWRSVSNTLRKFATNIANEAPELYETKDEEGVFMLRLSDRGTILADYV